VGAPLSDDDRWADDPVWDEGLPPFCLVCGLDLAGGRCPECQPVESAEVEGELRTLTRGQQVGIVVALGLFSMLAITSLAGAVVALVVAIVGTTALAIDQRRRTRQQR
jgi:hypothetical protein